MSDVGALLGELSKLGASVKAHGGSLVLCAGPADIPAELVAQLRQAKSEVLTILTLGSSRESSLWCAADWQAFYRNSFERRRPFYSAQEAGAIAWGEDVNQWHKDHGNRVSPDICAGCLAPIGETTFLLLSDGTRVHLATLECLLAYGKQWRGAATQALMAFGLTPPNSEAG